MNDWMRETLRREGDRMFEPHPGSEELVLFAEASDELSAESIATIERHLEICGHCHTDLARLRAAEEMDLVPATEPRGWRTWMRDLFSIPVLVPTLAAAVFAVLWMMPRGYQETAPLALSVGDAVVLRAEAERGEPQPVSRGWDGKISLMFQLPPATEDTAEARVRVVDAKGSLVAEIAHARPLDPSGTYLLWLDGTDLPAGTYRLEAEDSSGARSFSFVLP